MGQSDAGCFGELESKTCNTNAIPFAPENTGIYGDALIETPAGHKKLSALSDGDEILDGRRHRARVLHKLVAHNPKALYIMRAPYFGLHQDIVLGANQRVVITCDIANYLFGETTVMVPVWALCDGRKVLRDQTHRNKEIYQLQISSVSPIKFGECEMSLLYKHGLTYGKLLTDDEARYFAAEYTLGFCN